ncbi:MAG TPA: hypothetical protein VH206_09530 [Xanthobacteraceae bacterium]|nr:hypothetical protein [Xanthobacteraceae bacterium]
MISGIFASFAHHVVLIQGAGSVILLCGFIIGTTLLQQKALHSSALLLQKIAPEVQTTVLYQTAAAYLERRQMPDLLFSPEHAIPTWFLVIVVFFCSVMTYFGADIFIHDSTPSYVLGGAFATSGAPDAASLVRYQSQTVFIGAMAFLGAYIWTIDNLVMRINNYDTSPITFYFLSCRILTACLVAGIARHMVEALPLHNVINNDGNPPVPVGLAVLGFLIGWKPTLWINELFVRAADFFKQRMPGQKMPEANNMPQDMTLSMIQGLLDEKIARLIELDIDNCQKLACENAILIWLRTPYNLDLIVDWIGQAQLSLLFAPDQLDSLRKKGVRDIFCYAEMLPNDAARQQIQAISGIPGEIAEQHRVTLAADPKFQKLDELRKAIMPHA